MQYPIAAERSPSAGRSLGRAMAFAIGVLGAYMIVDLLTSVGTFFLSKAADDPIGNSVLHRVIPWLWMIPVVAIAVGLVAAADPAVRSRGAAAGAAALAVVVSAFHSAALTVEAVVGFVYDMSDGSLAVYRILLATTFAALVAGWIFGHRRSLAGLIIVPFAGAAMYWVNDLVGYSINFDLESLADWLASCFTFTAAYIAVAVAFCWLAVGIDKLAAPQQPRY
ncbi:hypothetical protein [Gordonia malaquae]|uniref:hypothetical protein n=1 Tax=Gordonia malaquae TaxID=410332 RepID=UPI00301ADA3E